MPDPDELAKLTARVDKIEPAVTELTNAVRGTWGSAGAMDRIAALEGKYSEIHSLLYTVKTQGELAAKAQVERDERREKDQTRRDKRINIYLGAGLTLIVTVLAALIISFLGAGGAAVIH